MRWVGALALLTVAIIALLPPRATARVSALARGGRLGVADDRVGEGRFGRPVLGAASSLSSRTVVALLAVAASLLGLLVTPVAGIDAGVIAGVAALLLHDARAARSAGARLAEIRSAVGLLEAELQAGSPPTSALAAAAASSPRLATALDGGGARRTEPSGSPAGSGAARWDAAGALVECDDLELRRLGVAWRVGETTGVPLADVLGRLAADLRAQADQRRAVAVALAGPRSSAVLLCLLPVLGIALGAAMGAHPWSLLVSTSSGRLLGCAGLLLDAVGVLWVRRILSRAADS